MVFVALTDHVSGNYGFAAPGAQVLHNTVGMTVAFDIAKFSIFQNGDLYYPGVASILGIIHCGGYAILFSSAGQPTKQEKKLIDSLTKMFGGRIIYARDAGNADMCVS